MYAYDTIHDRMKELKIDRSKECEYTDRAYHGASMSEPADTSGPSC